MFEFLIAFVVVSMYWLVFGNPDTIDNTPLGLPLQVLLEWTYFGDYQPLLAYGLSLMLAWGALLAWWRL